MSPCSVLSALLLHLHIIPSVHQLQISHLSLERASCQLEEQRLLQAGLGLQHLLPQLGVVQLLDLGATMF